MRKEVDKIRNFVIAGHTGSGKTTLCEQMLFKSGEVERLGSVDGKTSISDYMPDEQDKGGSIYASPLHCAWRDCELYFTDTPGYGEFIGETTAAMGVSDAAMVVVDGVNGLEVGGIRAWTLAKQRGLPRMIFINRVDRERSDFDRVLAQLQETFGKTVCVPFTVPIGKEADFSKVVHVLRSTEVPAEVADMVAKYREQLMDTVAESDEELMTRYLEGEDLSEAEISAGLHKSINNGDLVPVFVGSAAKDIGIEELMNGFVNLLPAPLAAPAAELADGSELVRTADGAGLGKVFKSIVDPFIGQLTFIKIESGVFKSDSEVHNISNHGKERFGALQLINGKIQKSIDEAGPGCVVAIAKLKNSKMNEILCGDGSGKPLTPTEFPRPVMSYAISAVKSGEEDKIASGLHRFAESDPTLKLERHPETHETLLYGMGDQHLANAINKLKAVNKVEVTTSTPKIPYRETITATGEGHYRHKKQSGGHGQFGEVFLRISPHEEGYEFVNEVVGGNIPKNFIPAVEKGVVEAMQRGPMAGCVVENVRVAVYDGKHHPVDSSEMSFKIAARGAFRDAMAKAKPIILEPVMAVKIMVPDEYMGDITGDLNHKRGRILGMGSEESLQVVRAEVPIAEMARYATELRSMTQGRGTFEMEFSKYEMVPANIANDIITAAKVEHDDEE